MPSWLPGAQHAGVWFESRLPSPNTTGMPPIRRIGWTTWACWPTTAVIAPDRASARASVDWNGSGACWYSVPQCRLTITALAPARRARRASRTIRAAWARSTDHGCGSGRPFVCWV